MTDEKATVNGWLEIKHNDDVIIIQEGCNNKDICIRFESGEGGDFSLEEFKECILKFYKERF